MSDDDDDDDDDEAEGDDDEGDSADAWSVVRRHQPLKKYCCRGTRLGSKGCRRENQREPRRAVSSRPVTAAGAAPRSVPAGRRVNARPAAPLLMVAKHSAKKVVPRRLILASCVGEQQQQQQQQHK